MSECRSALGPDSFLPAWSLGAAVGAGLALLFAPARARPPAGWSASAPRPWHAKPRPAGRGSGRRPRQALRDKKEALRARLEQGLEKLEDRLERLAALVLLAVDPVGQAASRSCRSGP